MPFNQDRGYLIRNTIESGRRCHQRYTLKLVGMREASLCQLTAWASAAASALGESVKMPTISRAKRSTATFRGRALTPDQRNCPISRLGGYNATAPEAQTHEWIGAFEPALQHGSRSRTPSVLVALASDHQ